MILLPYKRTFQVVCVPRVSGDDPNDAEKNEQGEWCSPRERG